MTSIHCISTINQLDSLDNNKYQQTLTDLNKNNSNSYIECLNDSTQKTMETLKTSPLITNNSGQQSSYSLCPFSPYNDSQSNNLINTNQIPSSSSHQISQNDTEQIQENTKEINESNEEEDDDDFPAPRQKSNTFTSGYISTHIPCEQKKSRFGQRLNLSIKTPFLREEIDVMNPEDDSSDDYDSTDDSFTANSVNTRIDFAKKRSSFFKNFKPESLKLIAPSKDEKSQNSQTTLKRDNFDEKFEIHEKLGEGCHSIVRRCCKKEDSPLQSYAVKIIAYKDPEYLFEAKSRCPLLTQPNQFC